MSKAGDEQVRGESECLLKRSECLVLKLDTPKGCK